jgi:hypothetical protein
MIAATAGEVAAGGALVANERSVGAVGGAGVTAVRADAAAGGAEVAAGIHASEGGSIYIYIYIYAPRWATAAHTNRGSRG